MKITTLKEAKRYIAQLELERDMYKSRAVGTRSDGTLDKYTDMDASTLRELVIKRGGDVDKIVSGFHSRARSIKMREWLRAGGKPSKTTAKVTKAKNPTMPPPRPEPAPVKRKKPALAESMNKAKAKLDAKKSKKTPRRM